MRRCMVDIETLGLERGSIILSIGAVYFDESGTGTELSVNVSMTSCAEAGLEADYDTLQWWLEQEEEAKECLTGGVELEKALKRLSDFLWGVDEIWANSPSMDCEVLEAAYAAVDLEEPWTYKEERDFRTLKSLYSNPIEIETDGTKHDALDDAREQAVIASKILRELSI